MQIALTGTPGAPPVGYTLHSTLATVAVTAANEKVIHVLDNQRTTDDTGAVLGDNYVGYKTREEEVYPAALFLGVRCAGACARIPLR